MEETRERVKNPEKEVIAKRGEHSVPQDIARDILLRLPAKSLLRFKSVCKNWCNIISEPDFQESNVQYSMSKIMILYQFKHTEAGERYATLKLEEDGRRAKKLSSANRLTMQSQNLTILNSCNNLILFTNPEKQLFVYDFITQQQKQLPELKTGFAYDFITQFPQSKASVFSLFYDESIQKCKVVVIDDYVSSTFYILTLNLNQCREQWRSKTWRRSKPPIPQILLRYSSSVILNGICYWMSMEFHPNSSYTNFKAFIQPINIATEEFMEIIYPPDHRFKNLLLKMNGSLCLFYGDIYEEIEMWVLKDSVKSYWIQQHKISFASVVYIPPTKRLMPWSFLPILLAESCCNTTKYILVSHYGKLCWYNMENHELRLIDVEISGSNIYPEVLGYVWDQIGF